MRKENALASKYELQVKREKRDLVPVEEVKTKIGHAVIAFRSKILNLGAEISPLLEGRDASERQSLIEARCTNCLNELADACGAWQDE